MKALAGTGTLVRLILRRDRVLMPVWIVLLALLPVITASSFAQLYPTAAEREAFAASAAANPAEVALIGRVFDPGLGGLVAWRLGASGPLLIGLASLLTVVRHTRAEEASGRRELLGSAVVGRHAPLTAVLIATFGAGLVLAALVAAGLVASGLPLMGAVALGLSWAAVGIAFAAVAGVAAQVAEGPGAARGIAGALLGLSFLARAAGDAGGSAWLYWSSPLGWAQRARPFADERWWALAPFVGLLIALVVAAYALSARRDLGSGLLPPRLGPTGASPSLRGPLSLAWRLGRGTLLAWTLGFALIGAALGGVIGGGVSEQLAPLFREGGGTTTTELSFSVVLYIFGQVVTVYAIGAALRGRSEEREARAEPVLAAPVSRLRWVGGHLLFAALGPAVALAALGLATGLSYRLASGDAGPGTWRLLGAAVAQLPAVWVLAGLAAALYGLLPRFAAPVAYGALAACLLLDLLHEFRQVGDRIADVSPFAHLSRLPAADLAAGSLFWLVGIAVVSTAAGLAGFRRRDVG